MPDEPEGTLAVSPYVVYVAEHLHLELAAQTAFPLLLAIDQFNFLFGESTKQAMHD